MKSHQSLEKLLELHGEELHEVISHLGHLIATSEKHVFIWNNDLRAWTRFAGITGTGKAIVPREED